MFPLSKTILALVIATAFGSSPSAQTIPNPSFEANSFSTPPGYVSDNSSITGWTTDNPTAVGLQPTAGDSSLADNGAIPDGSQVAFVGALSSLSTTISGLTAGTVYKLNLRANAPATQQPVLRATVNGTDAIALNIHASGDTNPYSHVAFEFTATAATAELSLVNDSEVTLLIDNLTIAPSQQRWTVAPWNDDATSGVDPQYVYTHAYSLGSAASTTINGVPFAGVAGANPSVSGKFSTANFASVFNNDANNITGGSRILANNFLYNGSALPAGTFQTINLTNLTPDTEHVVTVYTVGWEDPTPAIRWGTFSVGDDRLTINQDTYSNNNGLRVSHRFTADATGSASVRIAPLATNVSLHLYGFSVRESVSRNVAPQISLQPRSITLAEGQPLDLVVGASGFPAPTYQWRFNGANIASTSSTNTIASVTPLNAGDYDVIVRNSMGSVTSTVAKVVVGLPVANASFEEDTYTYWPGYSGDNPGTAATGPGANAPITGWTQDNLQRSGLNPVDGGSSPFADNGVIPHGRQVAFLQVLEGPVTLAQSVAGLTTGRQYYLHFYENSRSGATRPTLEVSLNGNIAVPAHSVPTGSYREVISDVFTASSSTVDILFTASAAGGDATVLIDSVTILEVPTGTPPSIVASPVPASGFPGETVEFTGQATGSQPLSYQWLFNGSPLTGETTPTLTLTNIQPAQAGQYSLQVTNAAGSAVSTPVALEVSRRIPGLFNTGVDDTHAALPDGTVDAHYKLVVNPHIDSQDAIVQDSTVFPIVAGPWVPNTATSTWIGPEFNTSAGAVGLYTYRLGFDLTGLDPNSLRITGHWASDNAGRDILVNGVSTGNAQSPGFASYTPFTIASTNATFTSGTNTLEFIVENEAAVGYTGLRVEFLTVGASGGGGGTGPSLSATKGSANTMILSWPSSAGNYTLEAVNDLASNNWAPVTEPAVVSGQQNTVTVTTTDNHRFFRLRRSP